MLCCRMLQCNAMLCCDVMQCECMCLRDVFCVIVCVFACVRVERERECVCVQCL